MNCVYLLYMYSRMYGMYLVCVWLVFDVLLSVDIVNHCYFDVF